MASATGVGSRSSTPQGNGARDLDSRQPAEQTGPPDRPVHVSTVPPEGHWVVRDGALRVDRMRTALLLTSISALIAAIVALVICALLVVAVARLGADMQSLVSAPSLSEPGGFVP